MADRGRKAFPVSSHLCDERWQRHCMDLHKQRLSDMKHRIDNTKPETFDLVLSKGKRQMLEKERQTEVDRENAILLQKMVRIKEQDTRAVFRPWTARSTFQWKVGHYYDPATNTKTLDHINLTSSVSPRSIHYFALTRPGTAPPDVTARLRDMEIQVDNTKLLRAITTMRTHYSNDEFERRHQEESILASRISNFRGPETARYQPPGRSISASRGSPYLAPLPGRASSSNRPPRPPPRAGWPATSPPVSQQQYYEEAQNRDIPPPASRGGSRPGTAVGGTQEGLGETSPRQSASSRHSGSSRHSMSSRHSTSSRQSIGSHDGDAAPAQAYAGSAAGSRPASGGAASESGSRAGSAAAAGTSFGFTGKDEGDRKSSASSAGRKSSASSSGSKRSGTGGAAAADPGVSADDYADEQYEQDETPYGQEEERREADEAERRSRRSSSRSSSSADDAEEPVDGGEEAGYGDDDFAADEAAEGSAAAEDEDGGYGEEATPRGDDSDKAAAYADQDADGGDGGSGDGPSGGDGDERPATAGDAYDADKEAEAFDPAEAELRAEMKAEEDAEMNRQFQAEMAAEADDDYGVGGGGYAQSMGGASGNTTASAKVGGFADDWY